MQIAHSLVNGYDIDRCSDNIIIQERLVCGCSVVCMLIVCNGKINAVRILRTYSGDSKKTPVSLQLTTVRHEDIRGDYFGPIKCSEVSLLRVGGSLQVVLYKLRILLIIFSFCVVLEQ